MATKPAAKPAKPAARPPAKAPARAKPRAADTPPMIEVGAGASAQAKRLAAEIEQCLAAGRLDVLSPEALQALMAAVIKAYAAQVEAGNPVAALGARTTVTPTEVMAIRWERLE